MGRDRSRKREKTIIVPILPARPRIENSKKKGKKIQKIKKHPSGFISSQYGSGQVEKERKKNCRSDPYYPIQNRKFQKEGQKKLKKLRSTIQASFHVKTSRDGSRKREKKIIVPTVLTRLRIENSEEKRKKNSKNQKAPFRLHFKPKRVETGGE